MPTATRAAVLRAFGEPHRIEEVELRDPGPDEARVRLRVAGVCHSDVGQADGEWDHPLPVVLGHEGVAVVEATGERVDVPVGMRVVLNMAPGCGACAYCAVGRPILCPHSLAAMGEGRVTTGPSTLRASDGGAIATYALLSCFADEAIVAARSLAPIPDDVPDDVAALIGCAVITGVGSAIATIAIEAGSRGAVIGAGGVGQGAIAGARARGAAGILALDPSAERAETARRFGATDAGDPRDTDLTDRLRSEASASGFDWTIVTVGSPDAIRLGVDALRPGGVCCVVGLALQGRPVPIDMLDLVTYEKRIVGSAYGSLAPPVLVPRIVELYRRGLLPLDQLAGERLELERIDDAFALSRAASGGRPLLVLRGGE